MKHSHLEIRVDTIDGSTRLWVQRDPELVQRTLNELHPALIFAQDQITFSDGDTETTLIPPLITRIDLMTEHWSVWDFPFVLGALTEVTEEEFMQGLAGLQSWRRSGTQSETPVFLDLEMVNCQRLFLHMQVVAGLSAVRLEKVYSLLKERRLIFGLRTGGIGILNLCNLVRFEVHPEPPQATATASARYHLERQKEDWVNRDQRHQTGNGKSHSTHSSHVALGPDESEGNGTKPQIPKEDSYD